MAATGPTAAVAWEPEKRRDALEPTSQVAIGAPQNVTLSSQ